MKKTLKEVKEFLKSNAIEIRKAKEELKISQRKNGPTKMFELQVMRREIRHWYLAYGLIRGKTYEQIEHHCREDNEPNMKYVEQLMSRIVLPVKPDAEACSVSA